MQIKAIEARFPAFLTLFTYDCDGMICGINNLFSYHGYKNKDLIRYMLLLAEKGEKYNLEKFTNIKCLLQTLQYFLYTYEENK